jgi:hypothetical protein
LIDLFVICKNSADAFDVFNNLIACHFLSPMRIYDSSPVWRAAISFPRA